MVQFFDPMPPKFGHVGWHIFGYICSNSLIFINPVIYVFANKFFRDAFLLTFMPKYAEEVEAQRNEKALDKTEDDQL